MKSFGSICLRTDGALGTNEDGNFAVTPTEQQQSLTIVLVGTAGIWAKSISQAPTATPQEQAESRPVEINSNMVHIGGPVAAIQGRAEEMTNQSYTIDFQDSGIRLNDREL